MRFRPRDRGVSRWDNIAGAGRGLFSHPFPVGMGAESIFNLKFFPASFAYVLQGNLYRWK